LSYVQKRCKLVLLKS